MTIIQAIVNRILVGKKDLNIHHPTSLRAVKSEMIAITFRVLIWCGLTLVAY